MENKKIFTRTLLSSLFVFFTGQAAAGFQLAEVSTSGLGRAYAGEAAIADNASVIATNPALMSKFKQAEMSVGGVYVHSKIRVTGPVKASLMGQTLAVSSAEQESVVPGSFVPNFYIVKPINDRVAFGTGMNVNYGLKSEYSDDYNAGVFGGTTDLTALNFNFSGSYHISQGWSAGVGLNAVYAKAELYRSAGIVDTALNNATQSPAVTSALGSRAAALSALSNAASKETRLIHVKDDAWGLGWNAGLLYEFNERNRIGVAYHSHVDIDFTDNDALSYQRTAQGIGPYRAKGELTLNLPAYWEVSGYHKLTDRFAMHYSYKYTEWSRFKELKGTYTDGKNLFQKEENFDNNSRIALGASYDLTDNLIVRAGIAYDEAAVSRRYASASIPDTDRTWYSLGATYNFTPNLSVDLGYTHIRGKKVTFKEQQAVAGLLNVEADYSSKSRANLYGINLNYRF